MSYQTRLRDWFATREMDVTLAKLGLLVSVLLFSLQLLTADPFLFVIPLSTGSACVLYLLVENRRRTQFRTPTLPSHLAGFLPSLVFGGLAAYVLLVWSAGHRTLPAYLLAGAIGTVVLAQILLLDEDRLTPGTILLQVFALALVLRLSALFATPGFIGIDTWTHLPVYVDGIVQSGSLSAMGDSKYVMAPIYHVFTALGTLVFGSSRLALYLTLGLVIPLAGLFIYEAGTLVMPVRWALFATALYAFADEFIRWGLYIIPTSLGLVFFLALVYALTEILITDAEWWAVALAAVFSLAVIFTHQVSTAIMLLTLGVAAGVALGQDLVSRAAGFTRRATALAALFVLSVVVTTGSWMLTPWTGETNFLLARLSLLWETILREAGFLNLASEGVAGGGPAGGQTAVDVLLPFLELFGLGLLLAMAVVGGLVMLRWDGPYDVSLTYVAIGAVLFVAVFGLSFVGVRVLLPGRWKVFMYVPLVLIGAVGLYYVTQTASRGLVMAVVLLVALTYPVGMFVTQSATTDSPAFPDEVPRVAYNEAEIGAVNTIAAIYPPAQGTIQTDHPYWQFFWKRYDYDARGLAVGPDGVDSSTAVVYRDYQSTGPAVFYDSSEPPRAQHSRDVSAATICPADRDTVYANDQAKLCLPTPVTGVAS